RKRARRDKQTLLATTPATPRSPNRQPDHQGPTPNTGTGPTSYRLNRTHDDADILIQRGG
ncbi:MAG: hypothetical protein Q8P38_11670, partial [Candidatus Nanopelagicales bacterium]|nr:hypothetical protein [Candidatus Nanopelagicales bacterium]